MLKNFVPRRTVLRECGCMIPQIAIGEIGAEDAKLSAY